jgi:HEPN domain-containing protein
VVRIHSGVPESLKEFINSVLRSNAPGAKRRCRSHPTGIHSFGISLCLEYHRRYYETLVDRRNLQELSRVRLKEARTLLRVGLCDGAYYLAGYAVECALKACIAKGTQRHDFPHRRKVEASHSHNLRDLVKVAGLEDARLGRASEDPSFRTNWEVAQAWSEQSRYRRHRTEDARALLEAVGDNRHGVMAWIKLHW